MRGDNEADSDIDIMILLKNMGSFMEEHRKYFDSIFELDLKYDTLISIVPYSNKKYRNTLSPFTLNIRKEGIYI